MTVSISTCVLVHSSRVVFGGVALHWSWEAGSAMVALAAGDMGASDSWDIEVMCRSLVSMEANVVGFGNCAPIDVTPHIPIFSAGTRASDENGVGWTEPGFIGHYLFNPVQCTPCTAEKP